MKKKVIRSIILLFALTMFAVVLKLSLKPKTVDLNITTTSYLVTETTANEQTKESSTAKLEKTTEIETTSSTKVSTTTTTIKETSTTTQPINSYTGFDLGFEYQMLDQINALRSSNGSCAVELDSTLNSLAQTRAKEISISYSSSHNRPDGSDWSTVLLELDGTSLNDWYAAGENIAYGQKTCDEIMKDFTNSSAHLANMISSEYTKVGLACYVNNGVHYWVQIFVGV